MANKEVWVAECEISQDLDGWKVYPHIDLLGEISQLRH